MSDAAHWVALTMAPDVGPVMARRLLAAFGTPKKIFGAGLEELTAVEGISRERAAGIREFSGWKAAEAVAVTSEKKGIRIVSQDDGRYPAVLRETEGAPVVLYMKGDYEESDRYGVAVVGSRDHSAYGEQAVRHMVGDLAAAGLTIISGMARGIDTLAHREALAARGRTIAVLGSGLDVCYPPENRGLMDRLTGQGCAVSEFPPGTMPNRENFPRRNRLISGLALGVLVVEAAVDSGSLITAQYALEQNREVFAVPGNITSVTSAGTNKLIRQGGRLVTTAGDIIEELAPVLKGFLGGRAGVRAPELTADESRVCTALSRDPKHIDLVSRETLLPVQQILGLLLGLEMKGVVRQGAGKQFYLA